MSESSLGFPRKRCSRDNRVGDAAVGRYNISKSDAARLCGNCMSDTFYLRRWSTVCCSWRMS